MKVTFCTPEGEETRDLTEGEIVQWAAMGNERAKKEVFKKTVAGLTTANEKIDALIKYLTE